MRIVYLSPQYAPSIGGVERHVAELATRAAAVGHEVEVLTQTTDDSLPRLEYIDGVAVRRFASLNGSDAFGVPPGLFAHLAKTRGDYDLIHAHSYHALPSLGALGAGDVPVVFTPHYHGGGHTRLGRMLHLPYRPVGRRLFRRANAVVCVSEAERKLVTRDFPEVADRTRVIPNGVDIARIRSAPPVLTTGRTILSAGRLEPYKRVDRLIAALPELPPDVRLVVIGDGPARADLEQQAAELGLGRRARFLGRVDDALLARWFRTADVVASLSLNEAYGLVLLEGLAGGAAIVASDIPAHREVLADHEDVAQLVPPDAPPAEIAQVLATALHRRGENGNGVPSWDEVAMRTWELYGALTDGRRVALPRALPLPALNGNGAAPLTAVNGVVPAPLAPVALAPAPPAEPDAASAPAAPAPISVLPPLTPSPDDPPDEPDAPSGWRRLVTAVAGDVRSPGGAIVAWGGLLVAVGLLAWAYSLAANSDGGTTHHNVFWLALAAFWLPAAARLAGDAPTRGERGALVGATALLMFLPKLLRNPDGPIYADELAHWRQTEVLARTGELFEPNPFISVVDSFPGLHTLSDVLGDIAGLSTWHTGVGVIALCMMLTLIGIFLLAEELLGSARLASLAALIYATCPAFAFFDAQYGYESMGMPLLVWILVAVSRLQRQEATAGQRAAWFAAGVILVGALVVTHHLTALIMAGLLGIVALVTLAYVVARHEPMRRALPVVVLCVFAGAATTAWIVLVADGVESYLAPHLTNGFDELSRLIEREQSSRQLFSQSTAPFYERRFAFLAPVVAGLLTVAGLWRLRSVVSALRPQLVALILLGLLYFPSVPFVLTQAGAEGARRSWAYSYLGVALIAAIGAAALARRRLRRRLPLGRVALAVALLALLNGNISSGLSVEYRFPGPYVFGSDTRSLDRELVSAQQWFTATQGRDRRLVADRASGLAFGQLGQNWTERAWKGFPLWEFYFLPERPKRAVFRSMRFLGTEYLVVDKRIPTSLPRTGVYVTKEEPGGRRHESPPPAAAIEKYRRVPWAIKVYESDNIEVYRLDYETLDTCSDQPPEPGVDPEACG